MRGLKLKRIEIEDTRITVAPPAGAWIETNIRRVLRDDWEVAPPAGAWIETGL